MDLVPIFSSHYSLSDSLLTFEPAGETKPGNPSSIIDLAKEAGLREIYVADTRIDGFMEAYKNASKSKLNLNFGIKFTVCSDINDKSEASLSSESNVIVFMRNTHAYNRLIKIYNRAWTENFYYQGRTSWAQLREFWNDDELLLCMPFFSSFLAKNSTTFNKVIPDLPAAPIFFREVNSYLPFESLISNAIDKYIASNNQCKVIDTKSIYYKNYSDFRNLVVMKCAHKHSTFDNPHLDHFASDRFCWEDYSTLIKK